MGARCHSVLSYTEPRMCTTLTSFGFARLARWERRLQGVEIRMARSRLMADCRFKLRRGHHAVNKNGIRNGIRIRIGNRNRNRMSFWLIHDDQIDAVGQSAKLPEGSCL